MSFRARTAIGAAAAVALAVVVASVVVFFVVRGELQAQIDDTLDERAQEIFRIPLSEIPLRNGESFLGIRPGFGEPNTLVQVVKSNGDALRQLNDDVELPVSDEALALASAGMRGDSVISETTVAGTHVRVLSIAYEPGFAVQIARPLTEMDSALSRIRLFLIVIALSGIGIAAALGLVVSRAALTPVRRLTETAERVTETGDLSERIELGGRDELSRLATSFNTMLAGLEESNRAQRQLVADASHELRTPLTSLRTNIEVLAGDRALPAEERGRLLSDVIEQLGEMTTLIAGLIELARAEQQTAVPEEVRLDLVAAEAIERTRRNRPSVAFKAMLEESVVQGVPATIDRAIGNLIDNAAKWSPPGCEIEVAVRDGQVSVRDHGPGIADEDLPYVFDRFYRARSARGMPGSGLGLAIVRQVAETHGGEVVAEQADGGGTRMTLRLRRSRVVMGEVLS
ncbi:MAG: ATP-binding protein [Actinomycetota bacterium]|nr:ATP-binding protein [Actinomycetota bacterium]